MPKNIDFGTTKKDTYGKRHLAQSDDVGVE
jgi:hypothetical protein